MKYKLFEDFNDEDWINESEDDLKVFLKKMELPIPQNIPKDGSWSKSVSLVEYGDAHDKLFDLIIESTTYKVEASFCEAKNPNEPRAKIRVLATTRLKGKDKDFAREGTILALIDNKWYYYDKF
jgi:hypothetical protein